MNDKIKNNKGNKKIMLIEINDKLYSELENIIF